MSIMCIPLRNDLFEFLGNEANLRAVEAAIPPEVVGNIVVLV